MFVIRGLFRKSKIKSFTFFFRRTYLVSSLYVRESCVAWVPSSQGCCIGLGDLEVGNIGLIVVAWQGHPPLRLLLLEGGSSSSFTGPTVVTSAIFRVFHASYSTVLKLLEMLFS